MMIFCTAAVFVALFAQLSHAATDDSAAASYRKREFYLMRDLNQMDAIAIKALEGDPVYAQEMARVVRALIRQAKNYDSSTLNAFDHLLFPKKGKRPDFSKDPKSAPIEELKEAAFNNIEDLADIAGIKNTHALHMLQFIADPDSMPKLDHYDKDKVGYYKRRKQREAEEKIRRAQFEKEMAEIKAQLREQGITPFDEEEDVEAPQPQEEPAEQE